MRATALLFARSWALVRPASRGHPGGHGVAPPHPLAPQMRAPEYRSGERLLRTTSGSPTRPEPLHPLHGHDVRARSEEARAASLSR